MDKKDYIRKGDAVSLLRLAERTQDWSLVKSAIKSLEDRPTSKEKVQAVYGRVFDLMEEDVLQDAFKEADILEEDLIWEIVRDFGKFVESVFTVILEGLKNPDFQELDNPLEAWYARMNRLEGIHHVSDPHIMGQIISFCCGPLNSSSYFDALDPFREVADALASMAEQEGEGR